MGRRGQIISGLVLALAGTGVGASALYALQAAVSIGTEAIVSAGIVITIMLLLLGKLIANERSMGKLEGGLAENSKRDDTQDRDIASLWTEAREVEGRIREAKHDAVNDCDKLLKPMEERISSELDDLQERVRILERGWNERRGTT